MYAEVILPGLMKGSSNAPIAQSTKIGWILSGACETNASLSQVACNFTICEENNLSNDLQRFWQIEEVVNRAIVTSEEQLCEEHYSTNVSRASDGKLIMRLPFKGDPNANDFLGNSHHKAYYRLLQLERRLSKDETLYDMYRQVLNE